MALVVLSKVEQRLDAVRAVLPLPAAVVAAAVGARRPAPSLAGYDQLLTGATR